MRNKRIAVFLCAVSLLTATSCGRSETDTVAFDDAGKGSSGFAADTQGSSAFQENDSAHYVSDGTDTGTQADNEGNGADTVAAASTQGDMNNQPNQPQTDTELDGDVESIGDNSIVINKVLHSSEQDAVININEMDLITIYFTSETTYEIHTVKNGGVNGEADVEKQQGAFSDIKEQSSVNLTGSYQGNDFYARHVIIYRFV